MNLEMFLRKMGNFILNCSIANGSNLVSKCMFKIMLLIFKKENQLTLKINCLKLHFGKVVAANVELQSKYS